MKKITFATMLSLVFSTAIAKSVETTKNENEMKTSIEKSIIEIDQMYYQCQITITVRNADGEVSRVETRTYTLSGSRDAAAAWCDDKADTFR